MGLEMDRMTAKRFTLFKDGETIIDNEPVADDGEKQIYWTVEYTQMVKLVELLNALNDENEQLKKQNKRLQEKIQKERNSFTKTHERWRKEAENKIKELVEVNKQLKEETKQLKELIHTMLKTIDVENINSNDTIYSARIVFSRKEFKLIREIWKRK